MHQNFGGKVRKLVSILLVILIAYSAQAESTNQYNSTAVPFWHKVQLLADSLADLPNESRFKSIKRREIKELFRIESLKSREESRIPDFRSDDQVYRAIAKTRDYELIKDLLEEYPLFSQAYFFTAYLDMERFGQYEKFNAKFTQQI